MNSSARRLARCASAAVAAAFAAAAGCGGTTAHGSSSLDGGPDGSSDASADSATACGHPPAIPPNGHQGQGRDRYYAVDAFFMGDTRFDGSTSPDAWKSLGFDLDGVATVDPVSMPNCIVLNKDQRHGQLLDGDCGIDNAFGHVVAPLAITSSVETNLARTGGWTLLIYVQGNDGTDGQVGLEGGFFSGAPLASPPKFDGTDRWPPTLDSVSTGVTPLVRWTSGFQIGGVLYSTDPIVVTIALPQDGRRQPRMPIRMHALALTFSPDLSAITRGVLAGIVNNNDLDVATSVCVGGGFSRLSVDASDILSDQTSDPNRQCNGVSIGIGFTAKEISLDNAAPGLSAECPDGGG